MDSLTPELDDVIFLPSASASAAPSLSNGMTFASVVASGSRTRPIPHATMSQLSDLDETRSPNIYQQNCPGAICHRCDSVFNHPEYLQLAAKLYSVQADVTLAREKLQKLKELRTGQSSQISEETRGESAADLSTADASSGPSKEKNTSRGNRVITSTNDNWKLAPRQSRVPDSLRAPDPTILQRYYHDLSTYVRPTYTKEQLTHVHNYASSSADSRDLFSALVDLQGRDIPDVERKLLSADRRRIVADLLDLDKTWTAQDGDLIGLCIKWLEMKYPRLALCQVGLPLGIPGSGILGKRGITMSGTGDGEGGWKAALLLKARFEEARKGRGLDGYGTGIRRRKKRKTALEETMANETETHTPYHGSNTNGESMEGVLDFEAVDLGHLGAY